jgi:hypothetical protein
MVYIPPFLWVPELFSFLLLFTDTLLFCALHCPSSSYFVTDGQLASPSRCQAPRQIFITVGHLCSSYFGAPSLTRGQVCNLFVQFTVTLRSKSRRTHDHILLSHLRLLNSLFVSSYDSQGYGRGIVAHLHTGDCTAQ